MAVVANTAVFWRVEPLYPEDHPLNPVNPEVSCKEVSCFNYINKIYIELNKEIFTKKQMN